MSKIKNEYIRLQELKALSSISLEDLELEVIDSYANPLDPDSEFEVWAKRQGFEINQDNYEVFYETYIEKKLQSKDWIEIKGNYYSSLDIDDAFKQAAEHIKNTQLVLGNYQKDKVNKSC